MSLQVGWIMTAAYEEERFGSKEDEEREGQLLDVTSIMQPSIVLHRTDISQDVRPEQQKPEHPHVKEEGDAITHFKEEEEQQSPYIKKEEPEHPCIKEEGQDPPYIKEEEVEEKIFKPSTGVPLKSEDEGQSETSRGAEPPSSSSYQRMSTEGDGDRWGGSQAEGLLAPLSSSENMLPHTPHNDESLGNMKCHIDNKSSTCSRCGKTFTCKSNFNQHVCIHTVEKPFACTVCGKRFKRKHDLKIHTRTHTGEKPYSCSVCGERFSQKRGLEIHTRTHTGKEKPFACSVCDRRFNLKAYLTSHMRTHTGEKPFTCSFCGQKFSHNTTLKFHTRIHTGENPFTCSVCDQTFSRKKSLERHIRTHTGVKRFTCLGCGQKFYHKETLERHKIIHSTEASACSVTLVGPCTTNASVWFVLPVESQVHFQ
ncbi:uncharacterized protein LOC144008936 isoform X1 [Festucalex cinctus]